MANEQYAAYNVAEVHATGNNGKVISFQGYSWKTNKKRYKSFTFRNKIQPFNACNVDYCFSINQL
jgi:hypothetical protein